MPSAWTSAGEAFERAIAADSDFALADVARAQVDSFYQQGDTPAASWPPVP